MELLHAPDTELLAAGDLDGTHGDLGTLDGGHEGDLEFDGQPAHGVSVANGSGLLGGRVDDQVDLAVPHQSDRVGILALVQPEHGGSLHPVLPQVRGRSLGSVDGESHLLELSGRLQYPRLVLVVDGDVHTAPGGQLVGSPRLFP